MSKPRIPTAATEFRHRHRVPVLSAGVLVVIVAGWALVVAVGTSESGSGVATRADADDRAPAPRPAPEDVNQGRYRFAEDRDICADVDWSTLGDAFAHSNDDWREELRKSRDGSPREDGTGWYHCLTELPVANNTDLESPQFFASFTVRLTGDAAVKSFEDGEEDNQDRDEWRSLDLDGPKICEDYYATSHLTELVNPETGDRDPHATVLEVGCRHDNALVSLEMHQYDVDDGSGARDATRMATQVLDPLVDSGFAALATDD